MPEGINGANEQGTAPTYALVDWCGQHRWLHVCQGGISEHVSLCVLISCLHPIAQLWIGWSESGHLISARSMRWRAWMVHVRCFDENDLAVGLRGAQPSSHWVRFGYGLTLWQSVWYREGAVGNPRAALRARDADDDWADATSLARYWQQVIYIGAYTLLYDPSRCLYGFCYAWFCSSCCTYTVLQFVGLNVACSLLLFASVLLFAIVIRYCYLLLLFAIRGSSYRIVWSSNTLVEYLLHPVCPVSKHFILADAVWHSSIHCSQPLGPARFCTNREFQITVYSEHWTVMWPEK